MFQGATIVDQRVCITRWGHYEDEFDLWNRPTWKLEDETSSTHAPETNRSYPDAGEAVTMAQEVVKTMLAKGYILGKDALSKAKTFDESHQLSATAVATVAELSQRIASLIKITKSAVSATGRTAAAAATTVVNSSYFSKGALWVSDALSRAAKAAGPGSYASYLQNWWIKGRHALHGMANSMLQVDPTGCHSPCDPPSTVNGNRSTTPHAAAIYALLLYPPNF
ncbi:Binding partner of ACD11 1 [Vitis vinifera]|uniref:Binding partner of ACD11 1 n=1 Tax=Vitis vinifera TaxID=29760 RepID=A0A438D723_VITVI|nr:Binding partner of ACD11 1 [Vitis vinifera]